ncbi:MAG: hypothetical protein NVSMB32_11130 [Actinomycetota bacterium]
MRGRLRLIGIVLMGAALTFVVLSAILSPRHTKRGAAPSLSPGQPSLGSPTPLPPPSPSVAVSPAGTGSPAAGHGDPVAVARAWALAEQSWDWRDTPDPGVAARQRASAWSTAAWTAKMGQSSSAGYLTAERVAAHEVDTVSIDSIVEQDPSTATSKVELVLSIIMVSKNGATPSPKAAYLQLTVVLQADGSWAVDHVAV